MDKNTTVVEALQTITLDNVNTIVTAAVTGVAVGLAAVIVIIGFLYYIHNKEK